MDAVIYAPTLPPDLWPILVHEGSHLLISHRLGLEVKKLEVLADGGYSHINFDNARLVDELTVLLAGETAEVEIFGRHVLPRVHAGTTDRERLYLAVAKAGAIGQQELFVARQRVVKLVRGHCGAIVRLATELLAIATEEGVMVDGPRLAALLDADGSAILRKAAV
jgi:hypothetical protein